MADLTTQRGSTTPLFNVPITAPSLTPQLSVPDDITAMANSAPAAAPQPQAPTPPKKHGAVHNILSTLGDFLLDSLGISDVIKSRRLNSAMQGFDQDPIGTISRVSGIDYAVGAKLRDQYIDNQRLAASQAATAEDRAGRLQLARQATDQRTRGYAASMLGSMATWDETKRQQFYPQMRQQVLSAGQRQGLDLSSELPEDYDASALDAFIDGAVPVGTQRSQRLTATRAANQDRQAGERIRVTERGQDIASDDRAAGRAVTVRGQDLSHSDRVAGRQAAGARATASGGRVRPIGSYTSSDGRRVVMMSDNTERVSGRTVRAPTTRGNTPAVGYRNKNGLTFRGGDPNNRSNWN